MVLAGLQQSCRFARARAVSGIAAVFVVAVGRVVRRRRSSSAGVGSARAQQRAAAGAAAAAVEVRLTVTVTVRMAVHARVETARVAAAADDDVVAQTAVRVGAGSKVGVDVADVEKRARGPARKRYEHGGVVVGAARAAAAGDAAAAAEVVCGLLLMDGIVLAIRTDVLRVIGVIIVAVVINVRIWGCRGTLTGV